MIEFKPRRRKDISAVQAALHSSSIPLSPWFSTAGILVDAAVVGTHHPLRSSSTTALQSFPGTVVSPLTGDRSRLPRRLSGTAYTEGDPLFFISDAVQKVAQD